MLGIHSQNDIKPGTLIGDRYRVLSRLGTGGQGEVLKVVDTASGANGEPLALKVVSWKDNEDAENIVQRLNTEYAVLSKLSHPNIVKVYDFGMLNTDTCFIAMEYIDGMPLSDRLLPIRGALPFDEVLHIMREVALGLECAHGANVIHRDLKPANIMLGSFGEVKILDFGLARDLEMGRTITKTGETIGTPYYMSPEQFTRLSPMDQRTDIYAFGMIAYELVAGKPPFKFNNAEYLEIATAHLRSPIPPLESQSYKLPPWFHTFVCVCTEKKPSKRAQSMREVIEFLEEEMEKPMYPERD